MIRLITRLHLAVIPLICTTTTYANRDHDQPIEDLSMDPNTTSDLHPKACKIMVFDPTSNNTCRHSDKIEDLCYLTEQSPSSQDSKHLTVTIPTNECQFILIKLPENDLEELNISSPDGPLTNGTNIQITITKTPNKAITIIGLLALGVTLGYFVAINTQELVAARAEVLRPSEPEQQRPSEPEQQSPPEPEQQSVPRQQLDLEAPLTLM